jgi:hypothetical protein
MKPLVNLCCVLAGLVLAAPAGSQQFHVPTGTDAGEPEVLPIEQHGERYGAPVWRRSILSPVYGIDRVYRSMEGPFSVKDFTLEDTADPELLWVTGYEAVMVEPDGTTSQSQEFMCHSNVVADPKPWSRRFPSQLENLGGRLFSLAQGQTRVELPEGFAVPIESTNPVRMASQALNHNVTNREFGVRTRVSVDFIRDRDLEKPLIPLVPRGVQGTKLLEGGDGYFGMAPEEVDPEKHGPGCSIGERAPAGQANDDGAGRSFTAHWVVKPGREENHSRVTHWLELPYDTTVHYIAAHIHPFAESLTLYDITADEPVYQAKVEQSDGKIGVARVDYFSSVEGLPLYADHEYELISVYRNTEEIDHDAMAVMFMYLRVKDLYDFDFRPKKKSTASR